MASKTPNAGESRFARLRLYAGILAIFAVPGVLLDICMVRPRPWYGVTAMSLMCGLIAVGWAYAFQRNVKFLAILIPASILVPMAVDLLVPSQSIAYAMRFGFRERLAVEVGVCALLIVGGYVFLVSYIRGEAMRRLRLETEVSLARRIHDALVPPVSLSTPFVEVHGRSTASGEVGGDLLDVVSSEDRVTLFVADVSGHGVAAGVVMAMVKSAIRMRLRAGADLAEAMNALNQVIGELTQTEVFVTASAMQFTADGAATAALAGHLSIFRVNPSNGAVGEIANRFMPLGIDGNERYESDQVATAPGDLFLIVTDGLTETADRDGQLFGEERIKTLLSQNADRPLPEILDALIGAVDRFGPATDDRTVLLVRRV